MAVSVWPTRFSTMEWLSNGWLYVAAIVGSGGALATRLGIPVVYEIRAFWEDAAVDHGTTAEGSIRYRATRAMETWALKRVDHAFTICEGLRADIKKNLEREVKRRIQAQIKEQVMNALLAVTPIEVPKALVQAESQQLADNARRDLEMRGLKTKDIPVDPSWFTEQAERRVKLAALREQGVAFPNDFRRDNYCEDLQKQYADKTKEELAEAAIPVKVAGRIMLNRGSFMVIQDMTGRIQVYVNRKTLSEETLAAVKTWDMGDIIAAEGTLARSGKGDLYVEMTSVRLLTKSLRPLPDKHHGLTDTEQRYRQRYVDLIVNE